jgi:hypothetical protein
MKLVNSPNCTYCHEMDDIRHFFLFCPKVKLFWKTFFKWWNQLGDLQIHGQCEGLEESILFGFQTEGGIFAVLNYCILIAKYHIYCQRIHNANAIDFFQFLCELKNKLKIENNICKSNNTIQKFDMFKLVYEQL